MRYTHVWPYRRILGSRRFLAALRSARRNALADLRGAPPPAGPYMAELDVTYRCNCVCRMCQRWRDPRRDELPLTRYRALAAELAAMGTHQISVAGGEPLMRGDVFEIIAAFAAQGLSVNLCTNGMLLERYRQAMLVEARLETGRTHQIRVHAQHQGSPIAGDRKYGRDEDNQAHRALGLNRLFLHAWRLSFPWPGQRGGYEFEATLPDELKVYLEKLK